jgi:four helix bundle protein
MLKLGHKKLNTCDKSLELITAVYDFCDKLPDKEKSIIIPQLKRAAISVASNIAEGYARNSKKRNLKIFGYCKIIFSGN